MTLKDMTVEIAPGVRYNTWAFDGHGAPGPVVHVREGQTVEMTLTNGGAIPHSIDFHAARIAPDVAFKDVAPGDSLRFRFTAADPGVYMYHCGTKPVLAHIANGMYGAIVVRPKAALPPVDNEYVLVGSEWYLNGDGIAAPASLDMGKARARMADWVTFNGYANQYVTHPLTAKPGETTRFWVVAAGPTNDVNFHVVGTIFDRAWVNSDLTTPPQKGVQTVVVPSGGGAVFDVKIDEPGLYPFVSHAFADVDLGQVGLLKVGNPKGRGHTETSRARRDGRPVLAPARRGRALRPRVNGQVFEAVAARLRLATSCDLYHSALVVRVPDGSFIIEQAPAGPGDGPERGVVFQGAVGSRLAGRIPLFRYELRCWRDGVIPDIAEAVESPQRLTNDVDVAQRLLELVPSVPRHVWGRDEPVPGRCGTPTR